VKVLVTRIIRHEGQDYRLIAGEEAPPMPPVLGRLCQRNGYIESPPAGRRVRDSRRDRKED